MLGFDGEGHRLKARRQVTLHCERVSWLKIDIAGNKRQPRIGGNYATLRDGFLGIAHIIGDPVDTVYCVSYIRAINNPCGDIDVTPVCLGGNGADNPKWPSVVIEEAFRTVLKECRLIEVHIGTYLSAHLKLLCGYGARLKQRDQNQGSEGEI